MKIEWTDGEWGSEAEVCAGLIKFQVTLRRYKRAPQWAWDDSRQIVGQDPKNLRWRAVIRGARQTVIADYMTREQAKQSCEANWLAIAVGHYIPPRRVK